MGVTFAFEEVNILPVFLLIGITTFLFSAASSFVNWNFYVGSNLTIYIKILGTFTFYSEKHFISFYSAKFCMILSFTISEILTCFSNLNELIGKFYERDYNMKKLSFIISAILMLSAVGSVHAAASADIKSFILNQSSSSAGLDINDNNKVDVFDLIRTKQSILNPTNSEPTVHNIYVTKSGSKYHYDETCNGGTYYLSTLEDALKRGLTPCSKCVHD